MRMSSFPACPLWLQHGSSIIPAFQLACRELGVSDFRRVLLPVARKEQRDRKAPVSGGIAASQRGLKTSGFTPVPEPAGVSCLLSAPRLNPGRCVDMDKDIQQRPREAGVEGNSFWIAGGSWNFCLALQNAARLFQNVDWCLCSSMEYLLNGLVVCREGQRCSD